ncbi:MAG: HAD family hydrolase, partial [Desulfobacterales bacterium]|nr:HAD family hydrolase [Desulfobacterales bacterium]
INSNQLKYDAYFKLFDDSERYIRTIRSVLAEMNEESRFATLEEILKRLGHVNSSELKRKVDGLADKYNDIVLAGAKSCAELPGAETALKWLAKHYKLYVSSTTPDVSLKKIVNFRGWGRFFVDVFGYPHEKSTTLQQIIEREKVNPSQVLVVGDGESDRSSAKQNSCLFLHVGKTFNFNRFHNYIEDIQQNHIS